MIRVGLVGFGLGGRVFHAPLLSSVEGLELAAVLERTSDNAAVRYPGITTYRSLEDMLADSSLGLIVITTPSGTHFDLARKIIEAGKNVVIDKPVAITASEIAQLMEIAALRGVMLCPYHNRRFDGDFLTLQKLLAEGSLGRVVSMESHFDRWRPGATAGGWREKLDRTEGGGLLLDLGTHLADQALVLFGKPEGVSAEILTERDGAVADDSFTLRLRYPGLYVTLGANCLSALEPPRYSLRGTKGNYWKFGLDPQEPALLKLTKIPAGPWGEDPSSKWGTLAVGVNGGMVTRPIATLPGDYRFFYQGVRDALLGKAQAPVQPVEAWRVAQLLEWAALASEQRCEIACDWSNEPKFQS